MMASGKEFYNFTALPWLVILKNHIGAKCDNLNCVSCYSASVSITWQNMQIIMDFLSKQGEEGGECDIS